MTTIITRLYSDKATAQAVVAALKDIGLDGDDVALVDGGDATARLRALRVSAKDAAALAASVAQGHPAVVVAAPFNPRGIALKATRTLDAHHPVSGTDRYIEEDYRPAGRSNLYPAGTYFMSIPPEHSGGLSHGHALSLWGLVSRNAKVGTSAVGRARHILPFGQIKQKSGGLSVTRDGGWRLSTMLGIPMIAGR
jgi:hypothetical protein